MKIRFFVVLVLFLLSAVWLISAKQDSKNLPSFLKQIKTVKRNVYTPHTPILDQIFSEDHSWIATLEAQKVRTVIATGDIIPARDVNYQTVTKQNFNWPYEKTVHVLKNADVTFANLEAPLIQNCPIIRDGFVFCGDSRNVEGLLFAGIDVVSIANNHFGNFKELGIKETLELLNRNNISVTGNNNFATKDIKGKKVVFLGYNEIGAPEKGVSWSHNDKVASEIRQARSSADIVIVSFHWGVEYTTEITPRQKELAHLAIDSGADLIIGNHPHWIQPLEFYKGKLIMYAHGNFVFDQMWSQKTKEGIVGKYTFYDNTLVDVEFFPIEIVDYGQPYFLEGDRKRQILNEIKSLKP